MLAVRDGESKETVRGQYLSCKPLSVACAVVMESKCKTGVKRDAKPPDIVDIWD